jgi:xanthine dehydrogenase accessory factor
MKNIYLQLLEHKSDISNLVLATVTRTHGSTPQKPGSSALFNKAGLLSGTVGGGVVEGRVSDLAKKAFLSGKSGHFRFDLANDIAKKEEAICGGQISILLDVHLDNYLAVFEQLGKSIENQIPGVLITMVTGFAEDSVLINRYWISKTYTPEIPEEFLQRIKPEADDMLTNRNLSDYREMELSIKDEEPSSLFFLEPVYPPANLVIAGAGHIGKSLAHLGNRLGFEVTVIDDRREYANAENIPEADQFIVQDIGEAMNNIGKNNETYVVIVTRGHKDDAAALRPCIGSDLAYVGMIGSKNKISSMKVDFIKNKWATAGQWSAIHSPVGIDIKSRTVEEIAISIAAELVLVRNSK